MFQNNLQDIWNDYQLDKWYKTEVTVVLRVEVTNLYPPVLVYIETISCRAGLNKKQKHSAEYET